MFSDTAGRTLSADRIAWIALALIMVFAGLVRYRLLSVPLERDEGEYAYLGQLMLQGVPPYQEAYSMKFPGIHAAYAVMMAVFGQTREGIHTGLLIINEITIVLVFLLARRLFHVPAAAVSAAVFALLSLGLQVCGVFANAEHFVILFVVAGLLLMLRALAADSLCGLFIAGILLGIGFTMKQHGFVFGVCAVLYIALESSGRKTNAWRNLIFKAASLTAGVAGVIIALCLIMIWTGVFKEFLFWTVNYTMTYTSQVSLQQGRDLLTGAFRIITTASPLLWVAIAVGFVCLWSKKLFSGLQRKFLFLYVVFSILSVCPGLYFRLHYFVLVLPCAALLAAAAIYALSKWLSRTAIPYPWFIGLVLAAICLGNAIYRQRIFLFQMTPIEVCHAAYGINPFPESLPIASFIRKHTTPDDCIAVVGSEPQIFFYAQRRSASGHIYMYPLMEEHPFALQMQNDFIRQTEAGKPKYLVCVNVPFSWLPSPASHKQIFKWMDSYLSQFRLVGMAELYQNKTNYSWYPQVQWPAASENWIAVFERITDSQDSLTTNPVSPADVRQENVH